jgi:hypothetical protein
VNSTPPIIIARRRWTATVVAVLLVAAAALLILGVVLERHIESGTQHPIVAATGEPQESHHDEAPEGTHAEAGGPAHGHDEAAERSTGIDVESPLIVALGGIASVALAAAVWVRPNRPVVAVVVAFSAAALVLDVLEIRQQLGADRIGMAALAAMIAALRIAAIMGSGYLYRTRPVTV